MLCVRQHKSAISYFQVQIMLEFQVILRKKNEHLARERRESDLYLCTEELFKEKRPRALLVTVLSTARNRNPRGALVVVSSLFHIDQMQKTKTFWLKSTFSWLSIKFFTDSDRFTLFCICCVQSRSYRVRKQHTLCTIMGLAHICLPAQLPVYCSWNKIVWNIA